ncbi:ATP-grasp domain-containing protein [Actinoallomurus sp. CA-150999]|uniref:ATP-grasp domain-containing protein n=1 Tax=Actinoallomurus sp. CA-150999 TaxID=3239887 RepID=UPI003D8BC3F0
MTDLLILGASEEQLPLYQEARRRGIRTIAVDQRRDRPALRVADEFLHVTTRDAGAIIAALGDRRPAAVVSAASDAALMTWHELCAYYATPYRYPRQAAVVSLDKAAFHAMARSAGVDGHAWVRAADPADLIDAARSLRLPLIVKPNDGSGGKGVHRVDRPSELGRAFAHARAYSLDGDVIAEEYVEGRHLVVELFLRDGAAMFAAVMEKRLVPDTDFMVAGHVCPVSMPGADRLIALVVRLCAAMGLRDGPADFDVVAAADGEFRIIEAGARMGGNGIPHLLRACYGIDNVAALISLVMGEPFDIVPAPPRPSMLRLLASPLSEEGELADLAGLDAVRAMPGVAGLDVYVRPGDLVRPFTESGHKIGHLVTTGASGAETGQVMARALETLRIVVVPTPLLATQGEPDAHV